MVQSFIISGNSTTIENITYVTVKDDFSRNNAKTFSSGIECNIASSVKHIESLNMYEKIGNIDGGWTNFFETPFAKEELDRPIGAFEYNNKILEYVKKSESGNLSAERQIPYDTSNVIIIRMTPTIQTINALSFVLL